MQIQIHRIEVRFFEGKRTTYPHTLYKRSCRGIVSARQLIGISKGGVVYENERDCYPPDSTCVS